MGKLPSCALGPLLCLTVSLAARGADRPNIVFLMSDDHQATALGCMGNPEIRTPHLDRLAARGVIFDRCYASSPICMPSRASVMLGMPEYKTGCNFGTGRVSARDWNTMAYAVRLKRAGYRIGFAGKWGFPLEVDDYASTYDQWGGFEGAGQGYYETAKNPSLRPYADTYPHVTRALGAFGRDFIRRAADDSRPFCLTLHFKAPHKPHDRIDTADQGLYEGVTFDTPETYGDAYRKRLPAQALISRHYVQYATEWAPDLYQDHRRRYYQLISGVDTAVGMVLRALEAQGLTDKTVVVYTSDNGYFCGAHGLHGKVLPYEEASRIPLIIADPRLGPTGRNRRCGALVSNLDFASTICDLAGLPALPRSDGASLLPLLRDPRARLRDSFLLIQNWGWSGTDHSKALAVVTEDWKYIAWCWADAHVPPAEELYHLAVDPGEERNVCGAPEAATTLAEMRSVYDRYHAVFVRDCVSDPRYVRMQRVFDRHLSWREKPYRAKLTRPEMIRVYQSLTGFAPAP